ncbi:MAG: HlyD family efflux transporter periplasmic adaptor subunit [Verrucomicrobia bacterium]|nr:HlyD family efflux transporter periplasmic adaptor subunit [Verrucomicrobiota bacterium]
MKIKKSQRRPHLGRNPRVIWRRALNSWPLFIWLAAIALVFLLYAGTAQFKGMIGVVETVAEDIAPVDTSRLVQVYVALGEQIAASEKVAQMDTSLVDAEIAELDATISEAVNSIGQFERSTLTIVRQFDVDIRDAEASLGNLRRRMERDEAELLALQTQQNKFDELLKRQLIDEQSAGVLRPQIANLTFEVKNYPALLAIEEQRLKDAIKGREDLARSLQLGEGETIEDAIRRRAQAQRAILDAGKEAALIRRASHTLRATRDGVVSRIMHSAGDVVSAGDPVVRLVDERATRVLGFLPEVYLSDINVGQDATLWRQSGSGNRIQARIASIAPEITAFPGRVSPIQGQSIRGRRVVVDILEPHDFIPGETVRIVVKGVTLGEFKNRLMEFFQ